MKDLKKISNKVSCDIISIYNDFEELQKKFKENKISEQKYNDARFVLASKAAYLSNVVDILIENNIEVKYENALEDLCDELCDDLSMAAISDLNGTAVLSILTFSSKYKSVLPLNDNEKGI